MRTFVALDLSIRSAGFAWWKEGQAVPVSGTWELAPHIDYAARAFVRLHKHLLEIERESAIDQLVFEEPPPTHMLRGQTNALSEAAKYGLIAHAMSFCEALGIRWRAVSIRSWRKHFLGSLPRGTKTPDLKHMAMSRCRDIGFAPLKHDEAEALGLLDYAISVEGIIAPWRAGILEREMTPATDGRAAAP